MVRLKDKDLLNRMVKTFEYIPVDKKLLKKFKKLAELDSVEEAYILLKNYNEQYEAENAIKIARPSLHDYDDDEIFTRLIMEAYVTAKLFHADDRLLNSVWSDDWETIK